MINNDLSSQLSRFFNRQNGKTDTAAGQSRANDAFQRLKAGRNPAATQTANGKETDEAAAKDTDATKKQTGDGEVSWYDKRKKELDSIMERLNREEAERFPNRYGNNKPATTTPTTETGATETPSLENAGALGFLNDLPLFNEFKSGLMDAFKMLDGATAGSINAQYELNYTSMQYVANEAGAYEYKETNLSLKLDLNYIKAASGGATGKEIASAIENSEDFGSLVENLKNVGQSSQTDQAAAAQQFDPNTFMTSMQDYFSPKNTAGRIVDFAAALWDGKSDRAEFGEKMRAAIEKGFKQAQGILGKVPKSVQDGIDQTYDYAMKGMDDFIKNGRNPGKEQSGVYSGLEQFTMNFEMSFSQKTVSVSSYNARGAQQTSVPSALDTQV